MIKTFTLFTAEIDEPDIAVKEINEQLKNNQLLKNSIGIIACHADSISSGVVKAVCESLPFTVVGATTLSNMTPGSSSEILLSLFVISGDGANFAAGLTEPVLDANENLVVAAYNKAESALGAKPSLILSFAPLLINVGGDFFSDAIAKASGGVPNFGTVCVDHTLDYRNAQIIYDGEACFNRYAFVAVSGITPEFAVTSIGGEKSLQDRGVVTASKGNQLISVNNVSVLDYFVGLGIIRNDPESMKTVNSYPFIVDYGDGTTPVVRVVFAFTPEGAAVCAGNIPVGAVLKVGTIDAKEVVASTEETVKKIIAQTGVIGILMFSCVGRYYTPGFSPVREMDAVRALMKETGIQYQYVVSGGEFCPMFNEDGTVIRNCYHNDTIIMCLFREAAGA
jgi:hypothetical protein